jgi:dynein regulatry complex protein 1
MSQDANKQAEQKIKLETEMQILEKCMEDMKAVYKLNQEKLNFNYDVLNERQQVYLKQKKGLKIKRQRDTQILHDNEGLFRVQQAEAKILNASYTKDYKFFTNEFIKLQKRFEKFEKADDKRIKEIWSMND